jgi:HSP90 family molecular chaperone
MPQFLRLPKRVERARRTVELKRIENLKKIHEELKRAAREDREAVRDFWMSFRESCKDAPEDSSSDEDGETPKDPVDREE